MRPRRFNSANSVAGDLKWCEKGDYESQISQIVRLRILNTATSAARPVTKLLALESPGNLGCMLPSARTGVIILRSSI